MRHYLLKILVILPIIDYLIWTYIIRGAFPDFNQYSILYWILVSIVTDILIKIFRKEFRIYRDETGKLTVEFIIKE